MIAPMPTVGRTYFIFFGNPGHYVKPVNKLTEVIGEFKVEDLL